MLILEQKKPIAAFKLTKNWLKSMINCDTYVT